MKDRPIKRYSKEEIFQQGINSAEIEGIFFSEKEKKEIWEAFKKGLRVMPR